MFNNGFAEGQNLSPTSPREVPLPEDDPVHMNTTCKLVHMQSSDVPESFAVADLADFALLCDKYDCANGVRAWSKTWMSWFEPDDAASARLLTVAYLLDLPREFRTISQNLLHRHSTTDKSLFAVGGHDLMPLEVISGAPSRSSHMRLYGMLTRV
jgi:hypothetical protein